MGPISIDYTPFAMVISFLLLVWLISKFAWNPLIKMMENRRNFIETSLANAEKERQQAELIRQQYKAEMLKARQEAQDVIGRATKVAEDRAAEIQAQAMQEAEKLKTDALAEITRERDKAVAEVKAQVADLSVAVAEKIIRRELDVKGQKQLIEEFVQEVGDLPC